MAFTRGKKTEAHTAAVAAAAVNAFAEGQPNVNTTQPRNATADMNPDVLDFLKKNLLSAAVAGYQASQPAASVEPAAIANAKPKSKKHSSPITIHESPGRDYHDRRILVHTKLVVNDGPRMSQPVEQRLQQDKGDIILAEAALSALAAGDSVGSAELIRYLLRRKRRAVTALVRAGPGTNGGNGSFDGAYELWHEDTGKYDREDFDPEAMDKSAIEAAVTKFWRRESTSQGDAYTRGRGRSSTGDRYANGRGYERNKGRGDRNRERSRSPLACEREAVQRR